MLFIEDNVIGTAHLLEWWRARRLPKEAFFLFYGTDEVFGPALDGELFKEWDRYRSTNPYSASKAAGEELTCAYSNTYGLHACATHCMNILGERQHAEKFVPMTVRKILNDELVTIHANADATKPSSRFYTYVGNIGPAIKWILDNRAAHAKFDKWNLVGEREVTNLEVAEIVSRIVGKPLRYELVSFAESRPGYDFRYALDGGKLRDAGFTMPYTFEQGLVRTVEWFLSHQEWLQP
jgi:dTDP-glucose 4,6-dehydratase